MEHILNNINKIYSKKNILKKKEIYLIHENNDTKNLILSILKQNFQQFTFETYCSTKIMPFDNVFINICESIEHYNNIIINKMFLTSDNIINIIKNKIEYNTNIYKNVVDFSASNRIDNLTKLINSAFDYIQKRHVENIIYYYLFFNSNEILNNIERLMFLIKFKYYNTNFIARPVSKMDKNNNYIIFIDNTSDYYRNIIEYYMKLKNEYKIIIIVLKHENDSEILKYKEFIIISINNEQLCFEIYDQIKNIFRIDQNI